MVRTVAEPRRRGKYGPSRVPILQACSELHACLREAAPDLRGKVECYWPKWEPAEGRERVEFHTDRSGLAVRLYVYATGRVTVMLLGGAAGMTQHGAELKPPLRGLAGLEAGFAALGEFIPQIVAHLRAML